MENLIERLRDSTPPHHGKCLEAADRIEKLEAALRVLRDLPIEENDEPNTLTLGGKKFDGPAVDWTFMIVRKIKQIAEAALDAR